MKVHPLLEKCGTKGKILFNKQKKKKEKTLQQQKNGINEVSFTLSDLYFNSWALRTVEDWQETMRRDIGEGITS